MRDADARVADHLIKAIRREYEIAEDVGGQLRHVCLEAVDKLKAMLHTVVDKTPPPTE